MVLTQDSLAIHGKTMGNAAFQGANISIGTLTIGEELERFGYITSGSLIYFRQFADTTIGKLRYCPQNAQTASDCFAGIFENAKITAGGYIRSDAIINSEVSAGTDIEVNGKKGNITGGGAIAGGIIAAKT